MEKEHERMANILSRALECGFCLCRTNKFSDVIDDAERWIISEDTPDRIAECKTDRTFSSIAYKDEDGYIVDIFPEDGYQFINQGDWDYENTFYTKDADGNFILADYDSLKEDEICYIKMKDIVNNQGKVVRLVARTHF